MTFVQGIEHALRDFFEHILVVYFQVFKADQNVLQINKQRNDLADHTFCDFVFKTVIILLL